MKSRILFTLPLAASLILPAMAQQAPADNQQQPTATSSSNPQASTSSSSSPNSTSSSQNVSSDENMTARQPLEPDMRQGFWGKLNPFARKKYVQRQLSPIRNRVNELDDLTAANAKEIKDVDARAQEGIRQVDAKATTADQHAVDAGNRAQQANQTALQASNHINSVEHVVGNIDQYHPATQTEIRFRSGQTVLSAKGKQALDDMTANLKDQKGYIVEVQGFSASAGQGGIQSSQAMANSVVRYLVEKNNVPVYRIFVMGLGNAKLPVSDDGTARAHGNRVEISLMKNDVDTLASAQNGAMANGISDQGSYSTSSSNQQWHSAPMQQPGNVNSAPSNSTQTNSTQTTSSPQQ